MLAFVTLLSRQSLSLLSYRGGKSARTHTQILRRQIQRATVSTTDGAKWRLEATTGSTMRLVCFFFASYSVHNSVSPPLPTASSRRRVLKQVRACVTKSTAPPPPPPLPLLRSNPVLLSATYLLRCLFAFRLCFVFTCSSLFQKCAHYLIVQHSPLHVCVCARVCLGRVSLSLCMRDGVSS